MIRKAVVAGSFYAAHSGQLLQELQGLWPKPAPPAKACLGAVVPHAGYVYSGRVAAEVFARLEPAEAFILLGPNHTGRGVPVAVSPARAWQTPLGEVPCDPALRDAILERCRAARENEAAHAGEHSLEVQLPFLQKSQTDFTIVCIALATLDAAVLRTLGEALADVVRACGRRVVLLASSDMNHFADEEHTRQVDHLALERVEALDPEGLLQVVLSRGISMCGVAPVAALLTAARRLGGKTAECVRYATSAEASGDTRRVVGYAGVVIRS